MKKFNLFLVCGLLLTAMFLTTSCEDNNPPENSDNPENPINPPNPPNPPDPPDLPSYLIDLNRDSLSFFYTGGNRTINLSSNGSWTASARPSWLTVWPPSGVGNETITVTASANESSEARETTLTFTAGRNTATLVITQGAICQGIVINGVRWASRNSALQGTFAENPENFGAYFMQGSLNSCPQGWRIPTEGEFLRLINTNYVTSEWTTVNNVSGRMFTDINPAQSFLACRRFSRSQ